MQHSITTFPLDSDCKFGDVTNIPGGNVRVQVLGPDGLSAVAEIRNGAPQAEITAALRRAQQSMHTKIAIDRQDAAVSQSPTVQSTSADIRASLESFKDSVLPGTFDSFAAAIGDLSQIAPQNLRTVIGERLHSSGFAHFRRPANEPGSVASFAAQQRSAQGLGRGGGFGRLAGAPEAPLPGNAPPPAPLPTLTEILVAKVGTAGNPNHGGFKIPERPRPAFGETKFRKINGRYVR